MRIKLKAHSRLEGAIGNIGDVIDVDQKLAELLIGRGGAVSADQPSEPQAAAPNQDPETAGDDDGEKARPAKRRK